MHTFEIQCKLFYIPLNVIKNDVYIWRGEAWLTGHTKHLCHNLKKNWFKSRKIIISCCPGDWFYYGTDVW